MNGNRIITPAIAIALLLAAALSSSCTREGLIARRGINFKARSTGFLNPGGATKTAYSGLPSEGQQLISWNEGDVIRVYSPQAYLYGDTDTHETDFRVKSFNNAGLVSTATITPSAEANSLQWGEGTHSFYAMYPTPTGSATNSFTNGTMVYNMPATQEPLSSSTSAGTIVLAPHMAAYAPMLAATTGLNPATNPNVPLDFAPQFTVFEVIINKGDYTTVNLSEFKIKGAEGDKLAGTFTVSAGSYNAVASIADASNVITMDLNGEDKVSTDDLGLLDSDNPSLQLTVFTIPEAFNNGITLEFTGYFNGSSTPSTRKITLKYAGGSVVQFSPYHKYRISGLSFPVVVDATIEDSIAWDFDLQISDSVVWWLAPGIENRLDWTQYDPELLIVRRDVVDWYNGAIVGQEIAWEELDHIALSSDADMYLWGNQTDRRTVSAVSRNGDTYSDVSAEWSCVPATGVVTVNKTFGHVQAVAPGEATVIATVTPGDGSTPYTVSYKVYVNDVTGVTLTPASVKVNPSATTPLTATITHTDYGTIASYPTLTIAPANTSYVRINSSTNTATVNLTPVYETATTATATANAYGYAEGGPVNVTVTVPASYTSTDTALSAISAVTCGFVTEITFPDWNEDGEPDGEKYKFRGYYVHPGSLYWNGSSFSITDGTDPLELLQHYYYDSQTTKFDGSEGAAWTNCCYFTWTELSGRLTTDAGTITGTVHANDAATGDHDWKIPTGNTGGEWDIIFNTSLSSISSPSITINGTSRSNASYNFVRVTVDLADATKANGATADYHYNDGTDKYMGLGFGSDIGNKPGNYQYQSGILLIPDGAKVSCKKISSIPGTFSSGTNCLGWDDLKNLTDGGCVFLPTAGFYYIDSWTCGGIAGIYQSAMQYPSNTSRAYCLNFDSNVYANDYVNKTYCMPVRLVRVAE